jgi:hypothetical protein
MKMKMAPVVYATYPDRRATALVFREVEKKDDTELEPCQRCWSFLPIITLQQGVFLVDPHCHLIVGSKRTG